MDSDFMIFFVVPFPFKHTGDPFPYIIWFPSFVFCPFRILSRTCILPLIHGDNVSHMLDVLLKQKHYYQELFFFNSGLINYPFTCASRSLLYCCCNIMTPSHAYLNVMALKLAKKLGTRPSLLFCIFPSLCLVFISLLILFLCQELSWKSQCPFWSKELRPSLSFFSCTTLLFDFNDFKKVCDQLFFMIILRKVEM